MNFTLEIFFVPSWKKPGEDFGSQESWILPQLSRNELSDRRQRASFDIGMFRYDRDVHKTKKEDEQQKDRQADKR